jgi:hypothetical protein
MNPLRQKLAIVFACSVALVTLEARIAAAATGATELSRAQLEQLVAPIALYPDPLVANVLEAAQYPDQVAEAARFVDAHPALSGQTLEQEVERQPWDPSVKALTEVPAVLANMEQNMSWTNALAGAAAIRERDVQNAIQDLRQRARAAGHLDTNAQQTITTEGSAIEIQPADPEIVYVPQYDPWIVYGAPLAAWPGWNWYPDLWWRGPGIGFSMGFRIGHGFYTYDRVLRDRFYDGARFHGGVVRGGALRRHRR